jgi:hypothetical protein
MSGHDPRADFVLVVVLVIGLAIDFPVVLG